MTLPCLHLLKFLWSFILLNKKEDHHKVGRGEMPRRLIRKLCRYSSLEKFEDTFDAAVHWSFAVSPTIYEL